MNGKRLSGIVGLATLAPLCAYAGFSTPALPAHSQAMPGDTVVGVVVSESAERIDLNIAPCASRPAIVSFHAPYAKQSATATTCNGASVAQVQVIQK